MEHKAKHTVTDDELNEIFGGPPPPKPTTTARYRFFIDKAESCRQQILRLDGEIMRASNQIAGHEAEAGAKYFVDRIAELRRQRSKLDREMLRALSNAGRR